MVKYNMPIVIFSNETHIIDGTVMNPIDINFIEIGAAVTSALSAILSFVIVVSILWSEKTRVEGFNLYLILNLVPDSTINTFLFIMRVINFVDGERSAPYQCILGSIFTITWTVTNLWINVLIVYEIHQMLQHSHQARRFKPSSCPVVLRRVSIVYVLSIIIAMLGTINTRPFLDVRLDAIHCTPKLFGTDSTIIGYTISALAAVVPCVYIIYTTLTVYRKKLLPPSGTSRFLAMYFLRIAFVATFLTIIIFITQLFDTVNIYMVLIAAQSIFVSVMTLSKHDINAAIIDTLWCCGDFELLRKSDKKISKTDPTRTASNLTSSAV